ncbi:MAG: HAD family hydrolase [Thermodesulfobacteriota bacterium]
MSASRSPSLVILDCDGVLFDSSASNVAFYNAILERMGLPPLDAEGERLAHWMGSPELIARLFAHDAEQHAAAREVARQLDYTPFLHLMRPVDELYETLAWLRRRGRTAMATNRGGTIPHLLEHFGLGPHFDLVVGMHDVARPKPAPDMLLRCLEHFGLEREQALYVGDSPTDREAAEAAGIEFVAVGGAAAGPRRIVRLNELRTVLS